MPGENQRSVSIPKAMYDEVRRLVGLNRALYDTIADFVQAGVREEIRKARAGRR